MDTYIKAETAATTNIGIADENRQKVAQLLEQLLADEQLLYIKTRNYHWNVVGMHFQALHDFFSDQYDKLEERIDDIAERIRTLGFFSPGSMEAFQKLSRLKETDHLNGDATAMLQHLLADHEMIIQVLRHDLQATLEQYGDAGTSDFLTGLMEEHEKMAWMIRAHLG